MLKKFFITIITIILIVGICSSVNATELKTQLDVIQKASETEYLENDQGFISKTIVDSNKDTGEVTIELKVSNTTKETETETSTEVFLVVDNSPSMDYITTSGESRKKVVLDSASKLVESIFNLSNSVKVGLIDFRGYYAGGLIDWEVPASIDNAKVRQKLTNKKDDVLTAIKQQLSRNTESGTNIQAGLKTAENNFSANAGNKVIILLTDGIPNADVNGTNSGNNVTTEDAKAVQETTKQTLLDLKSKGIYTITMLTGMDETDKDTDGNDIYTGEGESLPELLVAAQNVFGTQENPTADKYYLAKSADVNSIITNDILKDVTNKVRNPMNEVKIVDYFPEDIIENFEFSYVENASLGNVSKTIDTEKKTIEWNIGTLKGDEVATLKYKLKIKDMKNEELLNKTIATNEKVVLTYKDTNSKDYTVELTSSPKIQLSEVKQELTATVSYDPTTTTTGNVKATIKTNKKVNEVDGWTLSEDGMTLTKTYSKNTTETVHLVDIEGMTKDVVVTINNIKTANSGNNKDDTTVAPGILPQTGVNITITIASFTAIIVVAVIFYKKYNGYKDIK